MEWSNLRKKKPVKRVLTPDEQEMARWTAEAMTLPQTVKTKDEYRASSQPICSLYLELNAGQTKVTAGQGAHYTAIGTALHELLQNRFPDTQKGGQVWGNWQCEKCKHLYEACFKPKNCQKCHEKTFKYVEFEFYYKDCIGMHIDLLLKRPNGRFWLLDWKTCGDHVAENPNLISLPYPKNISQIETYCVALWVEHKIHVEKAFLTYLPRGEPETDAKKPKNQTYEFKMDKRRLTARKQQMDRVCAAQQAFETFKASKTLDNLKAYDNLRPCKNLGDYTDRYLGMRQAFRYENDEGECPFANSEGCFTKNLSQPARLIAQKLRRQ